MSMELVKLKDGTEAFAVAVTTVTLSLRLLAEKNPIALYELREKCRNPQHEFFGNAEELLQKLALVEGRGSIHDMTRQIVLNSVEGEMLEMRLVSPLHPDQPAPTADPAPVNPDVTMTDAELVQAIFRVVAVVKDEVERYAKGHPDDYFDVDFTQDSGMSPFYNQTVQGLFLEYSYGFPCSLWTPWGEYHFRGTVVNGPADDFHEKLLSRLGATVHEAERNTEMGTMGPVYALHQIDGVLLPDPRARKREEFIKHDDASEAWKRLKADHRVAS